MTANPSTAPAAMPSEEDVARIIDPDSWRHLEEARSTGVVPFIRAMERAVEPSLTTARAILDLFAPILAEKERAERKRCAKIAEGSSASFDHNEAMAECRDYDCGYNAGRQSAAAAIRAQG